jgi:hypothetical protein
MERKDHARGLRGIKEWIGVEREEECRIVRERERERERELRVEVNKRRGQCDM